MSRRRQINSDPQGRGGRLAGLSDLARWPFERLLWLLEERVLWPLRETTAGLLPNRRGAGAAALVAIAAVAALAAVALLPGGETPDERVAQPAKVAIAQAPEPAPTAEPKPAPRETARNELQGTPPDFSVGPARGLAGTARAGTASGGDGSSGDSGSTDGKSGAADAADDAGSTDATGSTDAATSSARRPVAPGPKAMKVARRFADAFLFYEIGKRRDRAEEVFAKTATPRLAKALGERPPRQPAGGDVPKARVVNLVPGPRAGRAYTVSVSLLRVGLTTELRLELRREGKRQWLVTDVRG